MFTIAKLLISNGSFSEIVKISSVITSVASCFGFAFLFAFAFVLRRLRLFEDLLLAPNISSSISGDSGLLSQSSGKPKYVLLHAIFELSAKPSPTELLVL
jgi:hypothetical protein